MATSQFLLKGQAVSDVVTDLDANTAGAALLRAKLMNSTGLDLTTSFASRPNTSVFGTDAFIAPANPGTSAWPTFRETPIPLPIGGNSTEFGAWNTAKTTFTVNKAGLYSISGFFMVGSIVGSNYNYGPEQAWRISLDVSGGTVQSHNVLCAGGFFLNSPNAIQSGPAPFSTVVSLEANQVIGLQISRSRYVSTDSSDICGINIGGYGAVSNWMSISRIR